MHVLYQNWANTAPHLLLLKELRDSILMRAYRPEPLVLMLVH